MRYIQYILPISMILLVQLSVQAQCGGDNTFTGNTSNDWHTASNWSDGCVPTSPIDGQITIQANCTISSGAYTFLSGSRLQIDAGIIFIDNSSSLLLTGELTGSGTYQGDLMVDGDIVPGDVAPPTSSTDVTNPITGETWMDRNLGALQVATSSADPDSYGDLYQWGRAADGHESRTSGVTTTNATTAVPNAGNAWDGLFILETSIPLDWLTPQDNTLWQGVSGTNNPCPSGYRLPTEAEWNAERLSWSSNNVAGAFASPLKLPVAGGRLLDGSLVNVGSSGFYWSSTVVGIYSGALRIFSSNAFESIYIRADGYSVRCLKD